MPSKISIHLSGYPGKTFDVLARMQPGVIKVFNQSSEQNIDEIRRTCPGAVIIYRQYTNLDYHGSADAFFAELGDTFNKLRGRGILWEGINEPGVNSIDDAKALNAWYVRFAQIMHARGELVAGFSWSTGNPVQDKYNQIVPYVIEAAAACDVHAFHEYYNVTGGGWDWGRYRHFEAALPAYARKPAVITEAGLDDTGDPYTGGYIGKKSVQEYLEILKAYDAVLMQDPYVLGATVFEWGDYGWPSFELNPMIDMIANYVASTGGGLYTPPPWPVPNFGEPAPAYSFSVTPTTILSGQNATLKWDVDNVRAVYLDGASVTGHSTRVVAPTQTTTYTLRVVLPDGSTKDLAATLTVSAPPSATFSFSAIPDTIVVGHSSMLKWDVDNVREVYLDGQGVAGHDTRVATPARTTSYGLHIVFTDGSTKDLTATVTVVPQPSFAFTATPGSIMVGQSATLAWVVEGARSVALQGQPVDANGSSLVSPTQTTTYVLHMVFWDGTTKDLTTTINVVPVPTYSFSASPGTIVAGASATLQWSVSSASSVTLNGQVVALQGTQTVTPTQTTTYTLRMVFIDGSTKDLTATINVVPVPTYSFSASPGTIIIGASATLQWSVSSASSVTLNGQTVALQGTQTVTPNQTTTYTLRIVFIDGSTKDLIATVNVAPTPTYSLSVNPATIIAGATATLQWSVSSASSVTLNGQAVALQGTQTVTPTQTTTYTLRIVFIDGSTRDLTATVNVVPAPTYLFSASPGTITAGASATLQWSVSSASSVTLNGQAVVLQGTQTVMPTQTTTYTLRIVFIDGSAKDLTATVNIAPATTYTFSANPGTITTGASAMLQWSVSSASKVTLNGQAVALQGTQAVAPTQTTTYTLHIVFNDGTTKDLTTTVTVTVPSGVTRSPTVVITPENAAVLRTYPRPTQDNGRGLHFNIDLRDATNTVTVQQLVSVNARWTMIYAQDELQAKRAAQACWSAGIQPIVRIGKKVDQPFDPVAYVNALKSIGAPAYVQIYNEPGDNREWNNFPGDNRWVAIFAARWAQAAAAVFDAGGYPGLQVLGQEEFDAAVNSVKAIGRTDIWQRAFFALHNYGANHPPAYPYDARNQKDHPGATILDDDTAVLNLLEYAKWMQDRIGFVLPIIGGEGGWEYGAAEDNRYPKAEQPYHAQYHAEIFNWFRTGVLSNGEPLPDYLFSVTPWIAGGWGAEDWWGGPMGDKTETINAVKAIPPFVRQFSWDTGAPPPSPTYSFSATPTSISTGSSSTLQWQVTGARTVSLDGQAVANKGSTVVTPAQTTTYALNIVFLDGTTKDLTVTVTVDAPPPTPGLDWDPRLDALGVTLTRSTASQAWRLISAQYQDESQAGGNHHVFFKLLNASGAPVPGVKLVIDWVGRASYDQPAVFTTDANGAANCPLWGPYDPARQKGAYFVYTKGTTGDQVGGMGLPNGKQVNFVLTFKWDTGTQTPPPPPPTPAASFSASPTSIAAGASSTLTWDTTGARSVTLNSEIVPAKGTMVVTPAQTTAYVLHIVSLDGTTKDLNATVTVTAVPPTTGLQWDSRLDLLGVQLTRSTVGPAWRLVVAKYQDENESGGNHHIYFKLLKADGTPAVGVKLAVDWKGRAPWDQPAAVVTDGNGEANCALWSILRLSLKDGPYFTFVKDQPSDKVTGMGLPENRHVNFLLTFKFQ